MTFENFQSSLSQEAPASSLPTALKALWYDAKGDWDKAHHHADRIGGPGCDWVHAYLHRKEGDLWNADYWYRRAGKARPAIDLDGEWASIVIKLLDQ